jgi:hypothetical protein
MDQLPLVSSWLRAGQENLTAKVNLPKNGKNLGNLWLDSLHVGFEHHIKGHSG